MARSTTLNLTPYGRPKRRRHRLLVRLLIVVAIMGMLLLGGAVWLYRALPRIAAAEIGRMINGQVETGTFELRRDGSVRVAGLVIRPKPGETQGFASLQDDTILRADHVAARFSRRSLLSLAPQVTDISIEDFLLDVQLDLTTGRWNIGTLRLDAPGGTGGAAPAISLKRGKLRYSKISAAGQEIVMSIPIEARFGPNPEGNSGYAFEIKTAKLSGGYGESRLQGRWRPCAGVTEPGELTLAGGLSSTDIPSLERAWAIDVLAGALRYGRDGTYTLDLSLKGLHGKHAPEVDMLRFLAPAAVQEAGPLDNLRQFFAEYQPTGTVGSIALKARGNIQRPQDSEIEGKVVCQDVSVCDNEFPYRLEHLTGELEFTASTVHAKGLVAKHGPVVVSIDGWTKESRTSRQYHYQITSRNMVLDKDLYAALNPQEKQLWDEFRPTGRVSVDYRLSRTSPTNKRLYLSVDLNDVTAAFQGFPYPLTKLTGNLFFDGDGITVTNVTSKTAGRQIQVNGKVTEHVSGKPKYYLSVDARDIPLDATLRDALPTRHRDLFRQFDANGLADIRARVFSADDANEVARTRPVAVEALKSTGPAGSSVSGHVSFLADVSCKKGSLRLAPAGLSPTAPPASPAPSNLAQSRDGDPRSSSPGGVTRLGTPEGPSLVISGITAEATITPDSMSIRQLHGRHGRSPVAMTGGVLFGAGDKLKQCRLNITAQQMPLDETTIGLLPPALAAQARAFHPEGDVNLLVELRKADSNEPPECAVVMECLGDKINHERFAYPLQEIRGTVTFAKDNLVLQNVTAQPQDAGQKTVDGKQKAANSAVLRMDGSATLARGTLQKGSLTLTTTDLLFTESLGRALPKALSGAYRELSPQGPFDLDPITVKVSQAGADESLVEFGGRAHLKSCGLRVPGAPTEVSGALEVEGSYHTKRGLERGHLWLAVDRLVVKGKAVTHIDIDSTYDPNTQKWTAENFVGDCYGGKLLGSLAIGVPADRGPRTEDAGRSAGPSSVLRPPSSGLEYQFRVVLNDVNLQQFLAAGGRTDDAEGERELLSSVLRSASSTSSGTMYAALSLTGRIGEPQGPSNAPGGGAAPPARGGDLSRRGVCRIDIADMQVGKVSPLGNVLSVLRLSEPTDYTFERMRIDSYLRADRLLIAKLDLSGRSAAFTGSGTMDLPTEEVNLTLTARSQHVAKAGPSAPGSANPIHLIWEPLQSLTEGLGGAVVRMEITGPASNPHVQTKALPVIEDSLRILGTPEGRK